VEAANDVAESPEDPVEQSKLLAIGNRLAAMNKATDR